VRTISQIIIHGEINGLGLSPDGRQIAFTWDGANHGRPNIYVQKVEGDRPMQITQSQSGTISGVDWSPDGRLLAFGHCGDEDRGALYVISPVGGAEQKITDFTCSYGDADAVWTPDGSALVFSDNCAPGGSRGISVFTLATGRKRCLAAPNSNLLSIPSLAVSPDGRFVAYVGDSASRIADVYIVPFSDGAPRRITFERRAFCCMMWTPDGEYIVLESDRTGQFSKWRVSAKGGAIEPETVYTQDAVFSRDGRRQAYVVEGDTQLGIWRAQLPGPGGKVLSQKRITPVAPSADVSAQLSPDGRQIVFVSTVSGSSENIWKADADGNNLLQLTSSAGQDNGSPHWSPDGKWIAFDRTAGEHAQIYVIDAEGRNLHAITDGTFASNVPTWSRDGKSIYFSSNRSGRWELWKQDIGSGVAAQITQHGGFTAVESYDGKDLYYTKFFTTGIWRMPIGGGEEQRITDAPDPVYWGYWDVAQAGLYFIDVGASPRPAIEFYDFRTQQVTTVFQLDELARSLEPNLSVSRDGRTIYYALFDVKSTDHDRGVFPVIMRLETRHYVHI
jgi:Tol biopolymer transport system component